MNKRFSVYDAFVYGFKSTLDNFRLFFLAFISVFAVVLVVFPIILLFFKETIALVYQFPGLFLMMRKIHEIRIPESVLFFLLLLLILLIHGLSIGFTKLVLEFYDTGKSNVKRIFGAFRFLPTFFIAHIVYWAIVLVGLMFLVLPGIYLGLRLGFYRYFIIDKNAGIIDSLRMSFAMTKGHEWDMLIVFILAIIICSSFTIICFPVVSLAYVYAYRKLA